MGYGDLTFEVPPEEKSGVYSASFAARYSKHAQRGAITITVKNVFYVPGFKFRLLSLKQLASNGASFWGVRNSLRVRNDREDWYLACECVESVYAITVKERLPRVQDAGLVAAVHPVAAKARLWHSRFGHLSYGNMARLTDDGMVQGLNVEAQKRVHMDLSRARAHGSYGSVVRGVLRG